MERVNNVFQYQRAGLIKVSVLSAYHNNNINCVMTVIYDASLKCASVFADILGLYRGDIP